MAGDGAVHYPQAPVSLLVGICGGSGSGKTTLAHLVADQLGPDRSTIIPFDAYYREQSHLSAAERTAVNYDHPSSLDDQLFLAHLLDLHRGREVAVPSYDFTTHTRTREVRIVEPRPVVILEGILLLAFDEVRRTLDLSVFRDCPEDVRFVRRLIGLAKAHRFFQALRRSRSD